MCRKKIFLKASWLLCIAIGTVIALISTIVAYNSMAITYLGEEIYAGVFTYVCAQFDYPVSGVLALIGEILIALLFVYLPGILSLNENAILKWGSLLVSLGSLIISILLPIPTIVIVKVLVILVKVFALLLSIYSIFVHYESDREASNAKTTEKILIG